MTLKEIKAACDIAWQEKFLELAGLKIGDEVTCMFFPNKGTGKESYTTSIEGKGIIVRTDKGIFVQSIEQYTKSRETKVYPNRPYNTKTYWKYTKENLYSNLDCIRLT